VHFIVDYPGKEAGSDACVVQDRDTHTIWVFYAYTPEGIGLENAQPGLTGPTTMGYHCVTSDDDGRTWSKPRDITPMVKDKTWNAFWPGPGRGIQTKAGRLVIPSTCWIAGGQPERSSRVIYSDDHGKAWQASAIGGRGTTESQVVELADGSLLLNMRLEPGGIGKGYRAIATSRNGGEAWEPQANETVLVDSTCQASLIRFTLAGQPFGAGVSPARAAGKNRLLFSNPASSMSRSQMTVRLSYDEGKTWPVSKVVYAGPSAYSCLTVLPDGTIGLLYEHGDKDPHEKIGFARFSLEWLTDGKDQLEAK
jgi:sialidase-1